MTVQQAKDIIRADPKGDIKQRLEALEVAEQELGEHYTMSQLWRWVEHDDKRNDSLA